MVQAPTSFSTIPTHSGSVVRFLLTPPVKEHLERYIVDLRYLNARLQILSVVSSRLELYVTRVPVRIISFLKLHCWLIVFQSFMLPVVAPFPVPLGLSPVRVIAGIR